jgi:hypothetical protein
LEDGHRASIGQIVFNYYDMEHVVIMSIGSDGWCKTESIGGYVNYLNGARMCSIETAKQKGWNTVCPECGCIIPR